MIVFLLANRKLHGNDKNHLILTARFAVLTTMLCVTSFHFFFRFKLTANIFNVEIVRVACDSFRYKVYNLRLSVWCLYGISSHIGVIPFAVTLAKVSATQRTLSVSVAECKTRSQSMRIILILS